MGPNKFSSPWLLLLILSSSCVIQISCQNLGDLIGSSASSTISCMQKLIPCQAYLKGSSTPPDSCCSPLKETVANDTRCLCSAFNNPEALKSLNIVQSDALALLKNCGSNANVSACETGAATPPYSTQATSDATSSNSRGEAASPPEGSSESDVSHATSHLGGYGFAAFLFAWSMVAVS